MMKLPPFKVWPQVALVWDPSFRKAEVTNQMGFFSISLGPLAIEIDGRPYVRWMTDVILPEARMMKGDLFVNPNPHPVIRVKDLPFEPLDPTTKAGYVHPDTCPCQGRFGT